MRFLGFFGVEFFMDLVALDDGIPLAERLQWESKDQQQSACPQVPNAVKEYHLDPTQQRF